MPLLVNLRHLEAGPVRLAGDLPVADLDIDTRDEVIQIGPPLQHDFEVQKVEDGLLVQGLLTLTLQCQCVRCLKRFQYPVRLDPWTRHFPLQGEDRVVAVNDCVDLTPSVREDILLEFPQHPLCDPECRGLPNTSLGKVTNTGSASPTEAGSPAWAELNKLKL